MSKTQTLTPAAEKWALPAQQVRSRAMQARILAAAETVFAEKGYDGSRISDIAKAAECSVGAVYFRFKDKDALFFAIAESFAANTRARFAGLLQTDAAQDPKMLVRAFVLRSAENFRAHKGMFRAIVERGFDHKLAMTTMMNLREEMGDALEKILRKGVKPARHKALSLAMRVLTQMIYGFLITGVLNDRAPTKINDDAAVDEAADAMIAYLQTKGFVS